MDAAPFPFAPDMLQAFPVGALDSLLAIATTIASKHGTKAARACLIEIAQNADFWARLEGVLGKDDAGEASPALPKPNGTAPALEAPPAPEPETEAAGAAIRTEEATGGPTLTVEGTKGTKSARRRRPGVDEEAAELAKGTTNANGSKP